MDIKGKIAIVTGSAGGIGRATAVMLAERGATEIKLVDVKEEALDETARLVAAKGARATTHVLDLADIPSVESWFEAHGDVDILHNNAGVVSGLPQFPDVDAARIRWIIDVNITSLVAATQVVARKMKARGGGVIVNTVSTVALGTGFYDAMYATTKAAVMMFTRCCAPLKEECNVRVAGMLPGLVDTPILDTTGAGGKSDWMKTVLANNEACAPEDIAGGVMALIEDDGLAGGDWVAVRRLGGQVEYQWGHADTV
ncbi:SDR family NAD(P)-dependent oxidoreductase [Sphingopyxis sp. JAI128]|uniref:SDR family NAD(P)-dependent oxidoreductase n=1 Tax=Sphingopyxis sp. JAI128 TaxID=2723066 RepID=UPI00160F1D10|nr:SDR family oxidoreductase [Sphingopyxis sp. JAI128]MBB6425208.1 3-oxoacyl-[acyl-carrier protein] reductase [Sphingopyxis sp. JAI128]